MSALRKSHTHPALQGHERAVLECVCWCVHMCIKKSMWKWRASRRDKSMVITDSCGHNGRHTIEIICFHRAGYYKLQRRQRKVHSSNGLSVCTELVKMKIKSSVLRESDCFVNSINVPCFESFFFTVVWCRRQSGGAANLEVSYTSVRSALHDLRKTELQTPLYGKASRNRISPWTSELSKYSIFPKGLFLLGHADKTSNSTHFPEPLFITGSILDLISDRSENFITRSALCGHLTRFSLIL